MKFIDMDSLVSEDAVLTFNEVNHILKEPNGYLWAEFNNKIETLDEVDIDSIMDIKEWLVMMVIPTLDYKLMTPTEFMTTATICQKVFNGGICELGKKLKPLEEIIRNQN